MFVQDLAQRIKEAKSLVLVDYQGLPVKQQEKLREAVRAAGGKFLVVKNTLLKLALKESGVKEKFEEKAFQGPTALVVAQEDGLSPLQALGRFIQEFDLPKIKVGIIGGSLQAPEDLLTLSRLPGREVLLGQLVGLLEAPLSQMLMTLNSNAQKLVYTLENKSKGVKKDG